MFHVFQNLQLQFALTDNLFCQLAQTDDLRPNQRDKRKLRQSLEAAVVEFLDGGGDLNACHGLYLPLHHAAQNSNLLAIHVLLNHGARPEVLDGLGRTAIHCAASAEFRCLKAILDASLEVDINAKDNHGRTPLHRAAARDRIKNMQLLLSRGADVGVANSKGDTVVHVTCRIGNPVMLRLILDFNPDLETTNEMNNTPMDMCSFDLVHLRRHQHLGSLTQHQLESFQDRIQCWRLIYRASPTYFLIPSRFNSRNTSTTNSRTGSQGNSRSSSRSSSRSNSRRASLAPSQSNCNDFTSPRNLQDICRFAIRGAFLKGQFIPQKLDKLNLPQKIREFLLLNS